MDSDLTGDALLKRIDELTGDAVRNPGGGMGWRHVLYAARRELRTLEHQLTLMAVSRDWWKSQCEEARENLRDALEDELRDVRDD